MAEPVRDFEGVNGVTGHGSSISGGGVAVVSNGMTYVRSGYASFCPSDHGTVVPAFGL